MTHMALTHMALTRMALAFVVGHAAVTAAIIWLPAADKLAEPCRERAIRSG
jgi:hypothetical protein